VITVVVGPPCSGKSTYVREHAKPNDIVIDFDVLAQAFGSTNSHDHSYAIRGVTMMARRAAIRAALTAQADVWIVETKINPRRYADYLAAGATIHTLHVDPAELHRRAYHGRPKAWHRLIDEWAAPVLPSAASREW
jgi:adenylate kinase